MPTALLRHPLAARLLAVGMSAANRPPTHDFRCEWCRERCRDRAELVAHEERHRINDRGDLVPMPAGMPAAADAGAKVPA